MNMIELQSTTITFNSITLTEVEAGAIKHTITKLLTKRIQRYVDGVGNQPMTPFSSPNQYITGRKKETGISEIICSLNSVAHTIEFSVREHEINPVHVKSKGAMAPPTQVSPNEPTHVSNMQAMGEALKNKDRELEIMKAKRDACADRIKDLEAQLLERKGINLDDI